MAVYQRNGHWYLDVTINGKRIRRAIKEARTKRQAEKAELVLRDEIFESRFGIGGQKNFAIFVEESYKPYAAHQKRGYTVELSVLKALLAEFGRHKLGDITTEHVDRFKRRRATEVTLRKTLRSKATVNRDIAVLSSIFNLAKSYGEIKENPVEKVKYYNNLSSRSRVLSEIEERILFKALGDDLSLKRKITVLLYTGMRRGELFKLEWRDIDLKDGFINIRSETTKTGRARTIPMLSNVRTVFQSLLNDIGEVKLTDTVFAGPKSQPQALTIRFREICSELGWDDLTIHGLRHTFSTRANEFSVGPFAQKELLGHSRLLMTDRYTHVSKDVLRASLQRFEAHITDFNSVS